MEFIKIRFGNDPTQPGSKFEKTIEEMFQSLNPMFAPSQRSWKPLMDIYEAPDEIYILAEIAGVSKADLELEINRKAVKIFGKRKCAPPVDNARFRLAEIQYGPFERILFLPAPIDTEKVTASYANGFLQIRMAKLPRDITHSIPIEEG